MLSAFSVRSIYPLLVAVMLGSLAIGIDESRASALAPAVEDLGDFVVLPAKLESENYVELAKQLSDERWLEDIAEVLNESLNLPVDIGMRFAECGQSNAFYDPYEREVLMCLELLEGEREVFSAYYETEEEIENAVNGSFKFTVFHEVGHALVDVLEIPVTGREEDTVDSLAAWWLIDGEGGDESIISGALSFYVDPAQAGEIDESQYATQHSLSQQRYYILACLVYGSDPENYTNLIDEGWLTPERAERCPYDFQRLTTSWYALLGPYLKEESDSS